MRKIIATMGPVPRPPSLSPALDDIVVDCVDVDGVDGVDSVDSVVTVDVVDFVSNSYLLYDLTW